jgi:hypothetical protein
MGSLQILWYNILVKLEDIVLVMLLEVHRVELSFDTEGLSLYGHEGAHRYLFGHLWSIPVNVCHFQHNLTALFVLNAGFEALEHHD